MKVLSLLQPWASLVVMGVKHYECRSWQTPHRGTLLIHASARKPTRREKILFEHAPFFKQYIHNMDYLPYGALIGQTNVIDIYPTEEISAWLSLQELAFDDYRFGRFAWHLQDSISLETVIPVKGSLGLWTYNGLV